VDTEMDIRASELWQTSWIWNRAIAFKTNTTPLNLLVNALSVSYEKANKIIILSFNSNIKHSTK
jgi:hypothetical protein